MQYTTRQGSGPRRAHVNYQCPCSCIGGVVYSADKQLEKPGRCCCGRLLMVGPDAEKRLRGMLLGDTAYNIHLGTVALPWGEVAETALAVPTS